MWHWNVCYIHLTVLFNFKRVTCFLVTLSFIHPHISQGTKQKGTKKNNTWLLIILFIDWKKKKISAQESVLNQMCTYLNKQNTTSWIELKFRIFVWEGMMEEREKLEYQFQDKNLLEQWRELTTILVMSKLHWTISSVDVCIIFNTHDTTKPE